jgi:hypothetical protein
MGLFDGLFGKRQDSAKAPPSSSRHPEGRAALLAAFSEPTSPSRLQQAYDWHAALGQPLHVAVRELVSEKLLEPPTLASHIVALHSGAELNELAQARGLPFSGAKPKVAQRLVDADAPAMLLLAGAETVWTCSASGRVLADAYKARQHQAKDEAERVARECIERGQFREAAVAVAAYEATRLFARGIGVDWANYNPSHDERALVLIWNHIPGILRGLSPEAVRPLRLAASQMLLWGGRRRAWIERDLHTGTHLGADLAARMFVFFAYRRGQVMEYKRLPEVAAVYARMRFRVACVHDAQSCEECQRLSKRTFAFDELPELPHVACTSASGCRCCETSVS